MVSFFVPFQTKNPEGGLMVNIKPPSEFLLRNAATLASVIVALARLTALGMPANPIVGKLAALPQRVIGAGQVKRPPKAIAFAGAERFLKQAGIVRDDEQFFAALSAWPGYSLVKGVALSRVQREANIGALATAIIVYALGLTDPAKKGLSASWADQINPVEGFGARATSTKCVMALLIAKIVLGALNPSIRSAQHLAALSAGNFDSITGRHTKALLAG